MAKKSAITEYLAKIGRRGGKARLERMTAEERTAIARKAGKASGKARAARKQKQHPGSEEPRDRRK